MTKTLENFKCAYRLTCDLQKISQTVENRTVEHCAKRWAHYEGEKDGIMFAANCVLSGREFKEYCKYTHEADHS